MPDIRDEQVTASEGRFPLGTNRQAFLRRQVVLAHRLGRVESGATWIWRGSFQLWAKPGNRPDAEPLSDVSYLL